MGGKKGILFRAQHETRRVSAAVAIGSASPASLGSESKRRTGKRKSAFLKATSDQQYSCEECDFSTELFATLAGHKLNHSRDRQQVLVRDRMGRFKKSKKKSEIEKVGKLNLKCGYPGCNKKFANPDSLYGHELNHSKHNTGYITCNLCTEPSFPTKN